MAQSLQSELGNTWLEQPPRYGIGGYDVTEMKDYIDANLSTVTKVPSRIVINLGALDAPAPTSEAEFKASYTSIIDSLQAKWAGVPIYISKVWRRDEPANCATLNGYIDDIIAGYSSDVYLGPDESVWLENGDDGATYTTDGIHYNAAAQIECAAQWMTAMGY